MKYDRKEAVRYMGGRAGDERAGVLADLAYLKLRNEVQARSVYRVLDCRTDANGVLLGGEYFKSAKLAAHIKGCTRAVLLAATLGPKVDIALRRMAVANIAEGAAGQAVCAALIESYCDETEEKISAEYGGLHFKLRFSPGYADWSLADQQRLLAMLDAPKRIGLTVTAGGMLAPVKSVTAVIGITETCEKQQSSCETCENNANCVYKK
ncbi:MAG: Vitamin B12 dependent methionine synthase activation subunit [Phascolarctobacterium sp.]|nr:MAG: Vitamin B12 dependent methionine synthase activation subunit [Phascolarctobacterium sp.]